jgi:hypothetical protein
MNLGQRELFIIDREIHRGNTINILQITLWKNQISQWKRWSTYRISKNLSSFQVYFRSSRLEDHLVCLVHRTLVLWSATQFR